MRKILFLICAGALSLSAFVHDAGANPGDIVSVDSVTVAGIAGPGSNVVATVNLKIADKVYINSNTTPPNFGIKTEIFLQPVQIAKVLTIGYPSGSPKPTAPNAPAQKAPLTIYQGDVSINVALQFSPNARNLTGPVVIPGTLIYQPTYGGAAQAVGRANFNIVIPKPPYVAPTPPMKKY